MEKEEEEKKKKDNMRLILMAVGMILVMGGLSVILLMAPETISVANTLGCGEDGKCNCKCDAEPDPDCSNIGQTLGVVFLIIGVILVIGPTVVFEYFKFSKFKKMENVFPRFMKDFSEAVKGGMTIPQALSMTAGIDYGLLSSEIKKTDDQVSWGVPFPKAMQNFSDRIKGSTIMKQSFTIINESFYSGGDIGSTMKSISQNVGLIREIEEEKKSIMSQQVYIIYFIFFMFLGIVVMLYKMVVPMLTINFKDPTVPLDPNANCLALGAVSQAMCKIGGSFGFGCEHIYFVSLFFFMCIIQGVSSGILAGVIGEGKPAAGVKHAGIMFISALSVFMILL